MQNLTEVRNFTLSFFFATNFSRNEIKYHKYGGREEEKLPHYTYFYIVYNTFCILGEFCNTMNEIRMNI